MANNGLKAVQSVFKALVTSKGFDRVLDKVEQDLVVELLGWHFSELFPIKAIYLLSTQIRVVATPKEPSIIRDVSLTRFV
jgi:hypothetical protein